MKPKNATLKQSRRVRVGVDFERQAEAHSRVRDFCDLANTKTIPALETLEIAVNLQNVIRYTEHPEQLKADYIKRNFVSANNALLDRIMADKLAEEYDTIVTMPAKGIKAILTEALNLEIDEDRADENPGTTSQRLAYNAKIVNEAFIIYLTEPAELEAYDRHQKAVDAMNEFFNGAAPDQWESLLTYFVPDPKRPGYMKAAELRSYTRFIKKN